MPNGINGSEKASSRNSMMAQELNDLFQSARRNQKKKNSRFPGKKAEEPDLDSLVPKLSLDALLQSPSPSPAAALRSRVYEFAKETPNGQRALPAEYPDNDAKIGLSQPERKRVLPRASQLHPNTRISPNAKSITLRRNRAAYEGKRSTRPARIEDTLVGGTKDRAAQYSTAGKVPINTQALNSPGTLSAKNQSLSLSASPYPGSAQAIQNKASPQRLSPLKVLLVGQRVDWLRTAEQEIHNEQSAVGSISSASEYFQLPAADEGSSVEDSELKREIEHEVGSDSEYSEEDDGYHFQSEESDVSLAEDDIKDKNGKRNASSECIQLEPFIVQEAPTEDASTDPTILYQDVSEVELLLKKYSSLISQKTRTLKAVRDGYEDAEEDMSLSINFDDLLVDRLAAITPNSADGSLWLMSSGLGESGAGKSLITAATDEDLCEPETPKDTPQVCLSAQDSYASKLDGSRSQSTPNSSRSQSRSGSRQGSSRSSAKSSYSSYTSQSGSTGSSRLSAVEQDPTKYMSVPVLDESSHESDSNDPDVPEDMSLESSLMIKNVNFQRPVKKSGPVSSLSKPQKERNALQAIMRYSQAEKLTGLKDLKNTAYNNDQAVNDTVKYDIVTVEYHKCQPSSESNGPSLPQNSLSPLISIDGHKAAAAPMDVGRGSSSLGMDVDFSGPCLPVQIYHYRHDSLSEKRTKSNSPKESQSAPIKLPSASISRALSPARLPSSPSTPIGANVSEGEEQTLHESNVRRKQRKTIRIPTRHSKIADLKIEEETELELNAEIPMAEVTGIFLEETEIPGTNAESSSHKSGKRHSRHRRSASSSVVTDKEVRSQRRTKSQPLKNLRLEKKKGPEAEEAEKDQNPSLELSGKNEVVHEDPRLYYARKRRSTASSSEAPDTTAGNISTLSRINESQNDSVDIMASTSSALYSSMQSSIVTLNSEANLSRTASFTGRENYENIANLNTTVTGEMDAAAEQLSQTLAQAMSDNGFLKAGNQTLFDVTHDKAHRSLILTDLERFKYSTLNDPGIPHDPFTELPIEDPEQISLEKDPHGEIDKISVAIKQSSAPVPSNFRRRGYLFMKIGRFDDALHDLDKAITFDPFNTDAFWLRHQLHLQAKDVELAVKDLNSITDNVKSHFGAFDAKARIYHALSLARLAIINYSAVIRLKPEFAYGYYRRACLFEEENEPVYANEDFRAVRQLDPTNQHAIFNLALYSFQRQLWDDSIQAFTKLISMNPDNGQGYLFRGRAYASLSRWDEALEDLTTSIKICPDKYQGFFHRGCLLRDRNPGQALIDFSTSILLDDTALNADAFYHRSLIYMKQGEDAAALADLKTVVALDETKSLAYLELGVLNMRLSKDHEQSLSYLNKAIEHDPLQLRALLCRADVYHMMYNESLAREAQNEEKNLKQRTKVASYNTYIIKATRDYSRVIHMFPGNYLLYLYRGRLLLKQGKMKEATYDFHTAFELNAGIAQTFVQRALVLSFQRKYRQIVEEFDEKSRYEIISDHNLYLLVAKARLKCGDNRGALRDLGKALKLKKTDPSIYLQRGICFENLKDWKSAIKEFSEAISLNPSFSKAYFHRAICLGHCETISIEDLNTAIKLDVGYFEAYLTRASYHYDEGKYELGIEDCNEALKLEPTSIRAHLVRGSCRCKINDSDGAIVDFTKAIAIDQTSHHAYFNRAVTFQMGGHHEKAIRDYSIVLLLHEDARAYRNRALLYWKLGDTDNAILDFYASKKAYPKDARLRGLLALALQMVQRNEESVVEYNEAIIVDPFSRELLIGRGNVHIAMENYKLARRDYSRVLHMKPMCMEALINMGYACQKDGLFKRAWSAFSQAIAINPHCHEAYEGRSSVNLCMSNPFGAMMDISKAIEILPTKAEYICNRGLVYQEFGDNVSTLQNFKLAIRVDPSYGLAYFNAANMYLGQGQWEQAEDYYNKAFKLNHDDVFIVINRGICKLMKGDKTESLKEFQLAAQLTPDSPEVRFNFAALLNSIGQHAAAEIEYSKVIALDPELPTPYLKRGEVRGAQAKWKESMTDYCDHVQKS